MADFKGKRILITGVSRGIGLVTAADFLKAGAEVFGTARGATGLQAAEAALGPLGAFRGFAADFSDAAAPRRLAQAVAAAWGHLDILVNNAGIQVWRESGLAEEPDLLERTLRVNVLAPNALIRELLPLLRKAREPRIINVSSGAGTLAALQASPDMPAYRVSKFALNGLTITWAGFLKGQVAVNSLDPGWLKTDLGGPKAPGDVKDGSRRILSLAARPFDVTGRSFHDEEIAW